MAEIINLKAARKAKARAEKERTADVNRAKFGRTKDERARADAEKEQIGRTLEGARLDDEA